MLNFKAFVTEGTVAGPSALERIAAVFVRAFERRFSTHLYRYGGDGGTVDLLHGVGILYFYDKVRGIRLNWIGNRVQSISLWHSYKLGHPADMTVDLGGLSLLAGAKAIFGAIEHARPGLKVQTYGDYIEESLLPAERAEELTEAAKVGPQKFYELLVKHLEPHENIASLSWERIGQIAVDNDVSVPWQVRSQMGDSGKGPNKRFDCTMLVSGKTSEGGGKFENPLVITIVAKDTETGKYMTAAGDKRAAELAATINRAVMSPSNQEIKKEAMDPDTKFGLMKNLVQVVARGARNALLVMGGGGIGKTYIVLETLGEEGLKKNRDYIVVKGKVTTTALYQTLFINRTGKIILFDDCDSVWGDADAANLLKAALDSYETRQISWITAKTINVSRMSDEEKEEFNAKVDDRMINDPEGNVKLPSEFNFESRVIFISNLPFEKFDSAVLTRCQKIDMTLTQDQIFQRMESIIDRVHPETPREAKMEILEFLKEQHGTGALSSASLRTFDAALGLYKSGLPNWKMLLAYQ